MLIGLDQWCAQVLLGVMMRHEIILVTQHLDHRVVRSMGLTPATTISEAVETALHMLNKNASVVVIPDGVSVMVDVRELN